MLSRSDPAEFGFPMDGYPRWPEDLETVDHAIDIERKSLSAC
jgi:hypothetical protein